MAANGELVFSLPRAIDSLPTEGSLDLFIHLPHCLEHLFENLPKHGPRRIFHILSNLTKLNHQQRGPQSIFKHILPSGFTEKFPNFPTWDAQLEPGMVTETGPGKCPRGSCLGRIEVRGPWGPMNKGDGSRQ